MRARAVFGSVAVAVCLSAACADLFDEPTQCKTDRDCDRFGAVCDVANGVCVERSLELPDAAPADGGTPPVEASTDAPVTPPQCNVSPKPTAPVGSKVDAGVAEITGAVTLDCEKDWILDAQVFVRSGATLTIDPGTTLRAKSGASIIVAPGGRLFANGQRESPVVITSDAATKAAGDWRGVFVLGLAPPAAQGPYLDDPDLAWGGANADDDSGSLTFVRVEYAQYGVVFAGVGRKTKIDSVQVRRAVDNCFFFYGGTADAKHLVCQYPGDEQFEYGVGYAGRQQFLFGQKTPTGNVFGRNGLLSDNSFPVLYNVTLCGDDQPNNGYGLLVRDATKLDMNNAVLTGWFSGVDATGTLGAPVDLRASYVFGNATNPAYAEDPAVVDVNAPTYNDDNGFDEIAWIRDPARGNKETDPGLAGCFSPTSPKPWPNATLSAGARTPPADGFFEPASYIGAFKDESDGWMKGAWVRFSDD